MSPSKLSGVMSRASVVRLTAPRGHLLSSSHYIVGTKTGRASLFTSNLVTTDIVSDTVVKVISLHCASPSAYVKRAQSAPPPTTQKKRSLGWLRGGLLSGLALGTVAIFYERWNDQTSSVCQPPWICDCKLRTKGFIFSNLLQRNTQTSMHLRSITSEPLSSKIRPT